MMKAGDVVRLRSGGPWMTVEGVREDGYVDCRWIGENGHYQFDALSTPMLVRKRWWHL